MVEAIVSTKNSNNVELKSQILDAKLAEVKDKQGFLGSIWNGFKELTGVGQSGSDCENMAERYKKGEVSFDEAVEYIAKYDKKQKNMSDLGANIVTGVAAIATATKLAAVLTSGPIGWVSALVFGAPVGAIVKAGVKLLDRATNNVKNDEFDAKQITKDVISGAITGTTSAVSSGVGVGIKAGKFGLAVSNGTKCGVQCGALSGASSYATDVVFDKDKKFDFGEFAKITATSAFVSGTVGAAVGAGMYGLSDNVGQEVSKTIRQTIIDDSISSSSRKILGQAERNILSAA